MVRADRAGRDGAAAVRAGQRAVWGDRRPRAAAVAAMDACVARPTAAGEPAPADPAVRPSLLAPAWRAAGHALGVATALIGPEVALACTAALDAELDRHRHRRARAARLGGTGPDPAGALAAHRPNAARAAPGHPLLAAAVRLGCRTLLRWSARI